MSSLEGHSRLVETLAISTGFRTRAFRTD